MVAKIDNKGVREREKEVIQMRDIISFKEEGKETIKAIIASVMNAKDQLILTIILITTITIKDNTEIQIIKGETNISKTTIITTITTIIIITTKIIITITDIGHLKIKERLALEVVAMKEIGILDTNAK